MKINLNYPWLRYNWSSAARSHLSAIEPHQSKNQWQFFQLQPQDFVAAIRLFFFENRDEV